MYEFQNEKFSGPVEKLFELIEAKKMDITEVSLGEVTEDFLNYIKKLEKVESRMLADFLVVASRLLLIKSKVILPGLQITPEEEEDIKDLEARLLFYQKLKPSFQNIKRLWGESSHSFSRPLFSGRPPVFYPSSNLTKEEILKSLSNIIESLNEFTPPTVIIKTIIISLEEKIKEITKRLEEGMGKFHEITKEKSRPEIIVSFLALLHLLSKQLVYVEQKEEFSDIIIKKN